MKDVTLPIINITQSYGVGVSKFYGDYHLENKLLIKDIGNMKDQEIKSLTRILNKIIQAYLIFKNNLSIIIDQDSGKNRMVFIFRYNDGCEYRDYISLGNSEEELSNEFDKIIEKAKYLTM